MDRRSTIGLLTLLLGSPALAQSALTGHGVENIRDHGARGDGRAIDSPAIRRAVEAAAKRGGGIVLVPPGRYLSFSIRLLDNVTLALSAGAVIEAADPDIHGRHYDPPENYLEEQFQDFGITHVHNSLIYADGASNIGVVGPGMLHGLGLDREGPGDRWWQRKTWQSAKAPPPKYSAGLPSVPTIIALAPGVGSNFQVFAVSSLNSGIFRISSTVTDTVCPVLS